VGAPWLPRILRRRSGKLRGGDDEEYCRVMALATILLWYVGIGVLAAVGTVTISRARFSPRFEHLLFALLLNPIAAMYLAFAELLILGYALHGAWDLAHEASLYLGPARGDTRAVTAIPLAYGVFCAAYDWCMAGYFYTRLAAWRHGRSNDDR
jgi:hypothetical protein